MLRVPVAHALAAEAIGTFALVFGGCGAIMVDAKTERLGGVGIAITFGLVVMAMIYAAGHISGAHFNPAVTFAFSLTRHFPWPRAVGYVGRPARRRARRRSDSACLTGRHRRCRATLPSGSGGQAFLWEAILTFFLMFVIMSVATDTRAVGEAAAIAIGGTVGLAAMLADLRLLLHPARSIGPAIAAVNFDSLWLYVAAPLLGAALGALAYQFVRGEEPDAGIDHVEAEEARP
jgi:aquaporin NIP